MIFVIGFFTGVITAFLLIEIWPDRSGIVTEKDLEKALAEPPIAQIELYRHYDTMEIGVRGINDVEWQYRASVASGETVNLDLMAT